MGMVAFYRLQKVCLVLAGVAVGALGMWLFRPVPFQPMPDIQMPAAVVVTEYVPRAVEDVRMVLVERAAEPRATNCLVMRWED